MRRVLSCVLLALLASAPAIAGERPRLVAGGLTPRTDTARFGGTDATAEVYATGGLRVGALVDSTPSGGSAPDRMAFGGYAGYALDGFGIASSLKGDATASAAELAASYAAGVGTTAVTLGYEWAGRPSAFSLNPLAPAAQDPMRPLSDLSLSVSYSHDLSSSVSLGGFAAASRSEYEDRTTQQGFRLGAGFGLRF